MVPAPVRFPPRSFFRISLTLVRAYYLKTPADQTAFAQYSVGRLHYVRRHLVFVGGVDCCSYQAMEGIQSGRWYVESSRDVEM
jgi:hypothetical protein